MHAPGCFGSALAFDEASAACQACPAKADCAPKATKHRASILTTLKKFSDGKGGTLAHQWLTPAEKRMISKRKKQAATSSVRKLILDSLKVRPCTVQDLVRTVQQSLAYSDASAVRVTQKEIKDLRNERALKDNSPSRMIELV